MTRRPAAQSASSSNSHLPRRRRSGRWKRRRLVRESAEQVRARVDAENAARHRGLFVHLVGARRRQRQWLVSGSPFFLMKKTVTSVNDKMTLRLKQNLPDLEVGRQPLRGREGLWEEPPETREMNEHRLQRASWSTFVSTPVLPSVAWWVVPLEPDSQPSSHELRASSLHRPPVSRATTTKRHLSSRRSSGYLRSLSSRALLHNGSVDGGCPWLCTPLGCEGATECDINRKLGQKSGSPEARTSIAPFVIRSHREEVHVPEFRVEAHCCSGLTGTPWPEFSRVQEPLSSVFLILHTRLCGDLLHPDWYPHSHTASATCKGNLSLSRMRVLERPSSIRNSGFKGTPAQHI